MRPILNPKREHSVPKIVSTQKGLDNNPAGCLVLSVVRPPSLMIWWREGLSLLGVLGLLPSLAGDRRLGCITGVQTAVHGPNLAMVGFCTSLELRMAVTLLKGGWGSERRQGDPAPWPATPVPRLDVRPAPAWPHPLWVLVFSALHQGLSLLPDGHSPASAFVGGAVSTSASI